MHVVCRVCVPLACRPLTGTHTVAHSSAELGSIPVGKVHTVYIGSAHAIYEIRSTVPLGFCAKICQYVGVSMVAKGSARASILL